MEWFLHFFAPFGEFLLMMGNVFVRGNQTTKKWIVSRMGIGAENQSYSRIDQFKETQR